MFDCWKDLTFLLYSLFKLTRIITIKVILDYLFTNVGRDRLHKSKRTMVSSYFFHPKATCLCWWISSSRLWEWVWQLAQWRWFMTGHESQRWMRRNNFDQSFPLTIEESSLLVSGIGLTWFSRGKQQSLSASFIVVHICFTQAVNSSHADTGVHVIMYLWLRTFHFNSVCCKRFWTQYRHVDIMTTNSVNMPTRL